MTKNRKRGQKHRRGQSRRSNLHPDSLVYIDIPSPFAGLSTDERVRRAEAVAAEASDRFTTGLKELRRRITLYEPTSLLAHLSFYHLSTWGGLDRELVEDRPTLQHHVELVQALALQHSLQESPWMPTFPDMAAYLELLDDTSVAFIFRRMAPNVSDQDRAGVHLLERMRMHTQAVRNLGYPDQISRIVTGLFRPLDERVEREMGLRIGDLYAMCLRLIELSEDRMQEHFGRLAEVARAKTLRDAFHANQESSESQTTISEETQRLFAMLMPGRSLKNVQELLIHHLNLGLPDVFSFSPGECLSAYPGPIEAGVLKNVLESWSLSYGDLAERDPEEFFLGNPIWSKPLIRLEEDKYFCPIPALFLSFGLELMEGVLRNQTALTLAYEKQRGEFLENEIFRMFTKAFPSAQVWRGSRWASDDDSERVYENDLLVRVDTVSFVVEAKAGRVSAPTRRGAEKSLKHDVNKLISAPAVQATRFAEFPRRNPGPHKFPSKYGCNEVDLRGVQEMVQIAVTLDRVGELYSHSGDLRTAGLLDSSSAPVLTLTLPDLESIFDLLDGQCEKAHYLVHRSTLERHTDFIGGELDLLDLYLDTAFVIDSRASESVLFVGGRSKKLDAYFLRHSTGVNLLLPQLRMTQWWRDILSRVEELEAPGWLEMGMALLGVSNDDQRRLEKRFQKTKKTVLKHGHTPHHEDVLYMTCGTPQNREAIATLACRCLSREERYELAQQVGYRAMELANTSRAVVIVVDVIPDDYPYSALYLAKTDPQHGTG